MLFKEKKKSINHLHWETEIDYRTIGKWVNKGEKIIQSFNKRNLRNATDPTKYKCICETMESELKDWINKQREEGKCVSGTTIQYEAAKNYDIIHGDSPRCTDPRKNFQASRGWFQKFCKRGRKPGSLNKKPSKKD